MTNRELVIDLYRKGYSINHIIYKIFNRLNKSYYIYFKQTGISDKDKYRSIEECRNLVESTILEHITNKKHRF